MSRGTSLNILLGRYRYRRAVRAQSNPSLRNLPNETMPTIYICIPFGIKSQFGTAFSIYLVATYRETTFDAARSYISSKRGASRVSREKGETGGGETDARRPSRGSSRVARATPDSRNACRVLRPCRLARVVICPHVPRPPRSSANDSLSPPSSSSSTGSVASVSLRPFRRRVALSPFRSRRAL